MTVATWPSYLLSRIPLDVRERLSREAETEDCSVVDVVRGILCGHYGVDCEPPEPRSYMAGRDKGSSSMLLRLQPEIFRRLSEQSMKEERPVREIVIEVLERHYGMEP